MHLCRKSIASIASIKYLDLFDLILEENEVFGVKGGT